MEREVIEPAAGRAKVTRREDASSAPTATHPALPIASAVGNQAFTRAIQRSAEKSQGAGPLDDEIASNIDAQRGGGSPLPADVKADMEGHLGADLSSVKVHTGGAADSLNRSVQAEAFTSGSDLFFSSGKYSPETGAGRSLLAHELTHVVQQSTGEGVTPGEVSHPSDPAEVEAKAMGDAVGSVPRATAESTASASVSRHEAAAEDEGAMRSVAREEMPEEEEEGVAASVAREENPEEEEEVPGA